MRPRSYSVSRIIAVPCQMMPTTVQVPNGFNHNGNNGGHLQPSNAQVEMDLTSTPARHHSFTG